MFAGFVPQMAAAVWVGDPDEPSRSLSNLTIGGRSYGQVYGATIAGPIWRDTLQAALRGVPVQPLPSADPSFVRGVTKPVPDVTGLRVADATDELTRAGFHVVVGGSVDSDLPEGTVARTIPGAGGGAPPGGTVTLLLSNGHVPAEPTQPPLTASPGTGQSPPATTSPASSPAAQPTSTCTPHGHGHGRPHC